MNILENLKLLVATVTTEYLQEIKNYLTKLLHLFRYFHFITLLHNCNFMIIFI